MTDRIEDGGPAEAGLVDPNDTGAAILRLLNKQFRLEDEVLRLRVEKTEMLEALEAAEPVIAFSLSYYGSDEAEEAHQQVRAAISRARQMGAQTGGEA